MRAKRTSPSAIIGIVAAVAINLFISATAAWGQEIRFETGSFPDRALVSFATPFAKAPVVIVSGQWQGSPRLSAAVEVTKSSFVFRFFNPINPGNDGYPGALPMTDSGGTWMQYLALVPEAKSAAVAAASASAADGARIAFGRALSGIPAVVCSAAGADGAPLYASATKVDQKGFTLQLTGLDGTSAKGTVQYIAVVPAAGPIGFAGASLAAGRASVSGGGELKYGFTPSDSPAVILCSAYVPGAPTFATVSLRDSSIFDYAVRQFGAADQTDRPAGEVSLDWIAAIK